MSGDAVTPDVCIKFFVPKVDVGCWTVGPMAPGMSMPETAVYEYDDSLFGNDDIWATRKILSVETKPIAECVEGATDDHFWSCILAFDPRHAPLALFRS